MKDITLVIGGTTVAFFFRREVIFLHPPSVYDFRKDTILFGPISDVIPSSSVFEMYPMGITSIADRLERAGYNIQIINVAYKMLRDPDYDPEKQIKSSHPKLWAIDLHWLPHVHGALALAELIKKHHPDTKIMMGGLSASYYYKELINNPNVDFIVRGDSTEEPVLKLLTCLENGDSLENVPNLTWKKAQGTPVINPFTHVPPTLDNSQIPAYRYMMRSVFKYWNLHNIVPYLRWMEYPMTALLISRGCTQNCSICGGSKISYSQICNRTQPAIRSPEKLLEDVRFINRFSKAPIFIIHDLRLPGKDYADKLLDLLKQQKIENEVVFELFAPAGKEYFQKIQSSVPRYSLEMTLESHDANLRRLNGKFACDNKEIESTIDLAMKHGCHRLDIFFMVGIPFQTKSSVMESMEYAKFLLESFGKDGRIKIYVAPLAPFLDPGSPAFENPDKYGYTLKAKTLAEHRERLTSKTWGQILNYESSSLPPHELVETTYVASARLVNIKAELGLITKEAATQTLRLIANAKAMIKKIEQVSKLAESEQPQAIAQLHNEAIAINKERVYDQTDFVNWDEKKHRQLKIRGIIPLMGELFLEEIALGWLRLKLKLASVFKT